MFFTFYMHTLWYIHESESCSFGYDDMSYVQIFHILIANKNLEIEVMWPLFKDTAMFFEAPPIHACALHLSRRQARDGKSSFIPPLQLFFQCLLYLWTLNKNIVSVYLVSKDISMPNIQHQQLVEIILPLLITTSNWQLSNFGGDVFQLAIYLY